VLACWPSLALVVAEEAPALWEVTLKDLIGHEWTGELVHFDIPIRLAADPKHHRLILVGGAAAEEIAFQAVVSEEKQRQLWCVVDLPPFGERILSLQAAPASKTLSAPMTVAEQKDRWQIDTGALRIEVPRDIGRKRAEKDVPAPLLRLQNTGGSPWVGSGHFRGTGALQSLQAMLERGPVFTDATLHYRFEKGAYDVRLRVIRGQPEVLWQERFDFGGKDASLAWELSGFEPGFGVWDYYRSRHPWRKTSLGVSKAYPIEAGHEETTAFTPWIQWWMDDVSTWIELWDKHKKWAVGVFTGSPLSWNPTDRASYRAASFTLAVTRDRKATLRLPLGKGVRTWGLSFAKPTPDERIGPNLKVGPADTARRQIKYAESPLDEVKDYVLEDATPPASYPLFAITAEDQKRLREAMGKDYPFLQPVRSAVAWAKSAKPLDEADRFWHLGVPPDKGKWPPLPPREVLARAALAGYAEPIQTHLRATVMRESLEAVRAILRHVTGPAMGIAPHNWMTGGPTRYLPALIDLTMPYLTERERQVLRARMLFLAYKLASEKFWSPRLGFAANPNMTTLVYAQLAMISFLFPRHPLAAEWRKAGVGEMFREVENWAGPNGGWLEAPHYATVALDFIVAIGYARKNLGLGDDLLYHPKLKKAVAWLAKISTPPDPRFKNLRHSPPIGNTWLYETSCLYGYMAKVYRDRDPEYANAMQWMWEQQGRPLHPGIGGAYPTTDGFREVLLDPTPSKGPPTWGSELFPGSGAILRAHFPSERETHFYLIQGPMHDHYDDDQGSFELWGKGRPLCCDFGYHGYDPAAHHNRVDLGRNGKIVAFSAQPGADFLHSKQGAWDRYVLFVKDDDPLGPNYFVFRDSVGKAAKRAGNWHLWLNTAEKPSLDEPERAVVRVRGRDDVDLDVWFAPSSRSLLPREKGTLKTEFLSIRTHSAGPPSTDQYGLHLKLAVGSDLVWLLYPRLRGEKPPAISVHGQEEALEIASAEGSDYVFLAPEPQEIHVVNMRFKGTAGVVQVRDKKVTLTLCQPGELRFGEVELKSDQPATKRLPR